MNIFKIVIYTFIAMIFCIHSAFAETEVDPQILSKVNHYYEINLAKGKGCNWFQVLEAFGNGRLDNPLGCSRTPYTSKEASNKPWIGWKPIADELKRLEDLRAEEEEAQDTWESFTANELDRQNSDTTQAAPPAGVYTYQWWRPSIYVSSCNYETEEDKNKISEATETARCTIKSSKSYTGSVKLHVLEIGPQRLTSSIGTLLISGFDNNNEYHYDLTWSDDDVFRGNTGIKVEVLPGDGYNVDINKTYRQDFMIEEDDKKKGVVNITYSGNPNTKQREDQVYFTIHRPHNPDNPDNLKVRAELTGYAEKTIDFTVNDDSDSLVSYSTMKSRTYHTSSGWVINPAFIVDQGDQIDRPLNVKFEILSGYYTLDEGSKNFEVLVEDLNPTYFEFKEDTLSKNS